MKKLIAMGLTIIVGCSMLVGCGSSKNTSSKTTTYTAMITSVDGSTVTLTEIDTSALEKMAGNREVQTNENGETETMGQRPNNKEIPTDENGETVDKDERPQNMEIPTDENGETQVMGQAPNGREMPTDENGETKSFGNGGRGAMLEQATGESHVITITDDTKITIKEGNDTSTGTIDDLDEGQMVEVKVDSEDKATAVTVQSNRGKNGGQTPVGQKSKEEVTTSSNK